MIIVKDVVFTTTLMIFSMVSADLVDVKPLPSKTMYGKMLQSLVDANDHRVQAMNKLYQLQEDNVGKYLRAAGGVEESTSSEDSSEDFAVLIVNNTKVRMHDEENYDVQDPYNVEIVEIEANPHISINYAKVPLATSVKRPIYRALPYSDGDGEPIVKEELFKLNITREQANMLRKSWRSSCDRKAAKVCSKACRLASKNACNVYSCKKGLKRELKRECKMSCRNRFKSEN